MNEEQEEKKKKKELVREFCSSILPSMTYRTITQAGAVQYINVLVT
jgi:hypothetical protein